MSVGDDHEYGVQLNLVPLIDILTNILFFLLVGFVAQEIQYEAENKIKLPVASTQADLRMSVNVSISGEELMVEKVRIAKISGGKIDAPMEGEKVVPLYEKLNTLRAAKQSQTGGVSQNDDVIFLVADRQIPFTLLSPVMKTAAMAGYPNFRFAVIKR